MLEMGAKGGCICLPVNEHEMTINKVLSSNLPAGYHDDLQPRHDFPRLCARFVFGVSLMSGYQDQSSDADIDIGQLFAAVWREKIRILIGALMMTVLVFCGIELYFSEVYG